MMAHAVQNQLVLLFGFELQIEEHEIRVDAQPLAIEIPGSRLIDYAHRLTLKQECAVLLEYVSDVLILLAVAVPPDSGAAVFSRAGVSEPPQAVITSMAIRKSN
jgi:hypothetical protein